MRSEVEWDAPSTKFSMEVCNGERQVKQIRSFNGDGDNTAYSNVGRPVDWIDQN